MMKKIISLVLVLSLLVTQFTVSYAATKRDNETEEKPQKEDVKNNITFKDVSNSDWFYNNLVEVMSVNEEFYEEFPEGKFRPNEQVTFNEAFKWLAYIFGDIKNRRFDTLTSSSYAIADKYGEDFDIFEYYGSMPPWYNGYAYYGTKYFTKTLYEYGYKYGYGYDHEESSFLNREVLSKLLYNGMTISYIHNGYDNETCLDVEYNEPIIEYKPKNYNISELSYLSSLVPDTTIINKEILFMIGEGIMTVKVDGKFHPYDYVTKAEFITAISRIIDPQLKKSIQVSIDDPFEKLPIIDLSNIKIYSNIGYKDTDYNNSFIKGKVSSYMQEGIDYVMLTMNRDYRYISNNSEQYKQELYNHLDAYKEYKGNEYDELKYGMIRNAKQSLDYMTMLCNNGVEMEASLNSAKNNYEEIINMTINGLFDEFQEKFIQDTIDNHVSVQAKFYTDDTLGSFIDGNLLDEYCKTRGVLRFKYYSHDNPANIKEELDLVSRKAKTETENILKLPKEAYDLYMSEDEIPDFEVGKWYEMEVDIISRNDGRKYPEIKDPLLANTTHYNYKYIYPISVKEIEK